MPVSAIRSLSAKQAQARPEVRPGFTVRVHERIQEGGKERIQMFEGLVIAVHKGKTPADSTFTVRRIASGVGVERIFSLHSPRIEKIEVKKVARVRRSKLFFLRGRKGKAARLSERFTTAEEFAAVAPAEDREEKAEGAGETDDVSHEDGKQATDAKGNEAEEAGGENTERETGNDDPSASSSDEPKKADASQEAQEAEA